MKTTFANRSGRADDSLVLRATAVALLVAMPLGTMAKQQAPTAAPVKAPAEAAAPTTATYGDWLVTCPPPAATGAAAACEATQTLTLEGKGPIARIAVGRLTKGGDLSFAVMLPAAVEFSAPVVLVPRPPRLRSSRSAGGVAFLPVALRMPRLPVRCPRHGSPKQ